MRKLKEWVLLLAMTASAPLHAATATDFYVSLLNRGIAEVEAGRDATAVTPLRLAAFGLVESIEHYETAQVHLVIALDRLNQPDSAREAAMRIMAAERVERKFGSITLSPAIRTAFSASAKKLLTPGEAAALLNATAAPAVQSQRPQTPARVVESPSRPVVEKPAAAATTTTTTAPPPSTTRRLEDPKPPPAPTRTVEDPKTPPSTTRRLEDSKTPPATKPAPAQIAAPAKPAVDVPARVAAGERALSAANLAEARKIYRELLDAPGVDHATWIRIAEGLYRSRDFAGALTAFQRVGTLRSGEEAYRYYVAVALYETGQYDRARRELAAALPFIEVTPDVERYRAKIEAAR
jgi:tetratricopeptide (TPR) repeat protein